MRSQLKPMNLSRVLLLAIAGLSFSLARSQEARTPVCPRDDAGFAAIQKRVEGKDPEAQSALASCYDLGMHVQPNGKESIRWLTEAANQGYGPAEYELGRIYLYGRGVPADYAQALLWERKAAEKGDSRAQRDLAFMYERGFGVEADPTQATEWNHKAAAQGNAEAQLELAKALEYGLGIKKNAEEARKWYAKAANQEQPEAQLEMARQAAGQGNCPVAVHWYEEAAGHGETQAMVELGRLYAMKCGRNLEQAQKWFLIGAKSGSDESKDFAEFTARKMLPAQRKRAEIAAEKWIKDHPGSGKEEDEEEKR